MKKIFSLSLLLGLLISVTHCSKNAKATCNDGIQNQNETKIDCGGPCATCGTCSDGILNQDETKVDCGGVCSVCQTCSDGMQNQGETGIDCGGPCGLCPIIYPKQGLYGDNLLHDSTMHIQSSNPNSSNITYYSLAAKLPNNSSLRIRMTCSTGIKWYVTVGTGNWLRNDFFPNTVEYITNGPVSQDLKIFFTSNGSATIESYENGASSPAKTKTINW